MNACRFVPSIVEGLAEWLEDEAPIIETQPALKIAALALTEAGIDLGHRCWWRVEDAVLIAEAVNLAAKVIDSAFYDLKPDCVRECIEMGAEGGWEGDVFYLFHDAVGVASFHDPFDQIDADASMRWHFKWSGIARQDRAFELLTDARLLQKYRFATYPGELGEWCRGWLWQARPVGKLP